MDNYTRLKNFAQLMKVSVQITTLMFGLAVAIMVIGYIKGIQNIHLISIGFFLILGVIGIILFYRAYNNHNTIADEFIQKDRKYHNKNTKD